MSRKHRCETCAKHRNGNRNLHEPVQVIMTWRRWKAPTTCSERGSRSCGGRKRFLQRQRNFSEEHFLLDESENLSNYTSGFITSNLNGPLKTSELQAVEIFKDQACDLEDEGIDRAVRRDRPLATIMVRSSALVVSLREDAYWSSRIVAP